MYTGKSQKEKTRATSRATRVFKSIRGGKTSTKFNGFNQGFNQSALD